MHGLFLKFMLMGLMCEDSEGIHFILHIVSDPFFALLVFSTTLVAASGNIINDYFDVKIDRINKPEKLIVDRYISKRKAILFHTILNFIAVFIALIIWYFRSNYWPLIFHLITTSFLWMYSGILKRKFLTGNVTIAILTAMVPMLVYLFDKGQFSVDNFAHTQAFNAMGFFALFAFFTTLIREIQKDFADMKGDSMYGCQTVPLYLGIRKGRMILFFVFAATIVTFIVLFVLLAKLNALNISFFVVVGFLMLVSLIQSFKAVRRKSWVRAAGTMKLVMVIALLFFVVKIYV